MRQWCGEEEEEEEEEEVKGTVMSSERCSSTREGMLHPLFPLYSLHMPLNRYARQGAACHCLHLKTSLYSVLSLGVLSKQALLSVLRRWPLRYFVICEWLEEMLADNCSEGLQTLVTDWWPCAQRSGQSCMGWMGVETAPAQSSSRTH
ncbi:hypothetical protein TcWFU_009370 [Taenia crassiceps]|uniref:Uncharacterized protein n=1 Tax=Taenia crassiceps TaxID=6207 RepID=A0ABR4Q5W9_9CEST